MATLEVKKAGGAAGGGKVELDPTVFEAQVKPHLFHAEVRRQLAQRRAGTHATRNRSGVSGGGAKPWRQKGTGRARQGSIRAPQWAGGGIVFGPVPRTHAHGLPKKVRRAALRGALSLRVREERLAVVEGLALEAPRTRLLLEALRGLGLEARSVLLVVGEPDRTLELAARNLPGVDVLCAAGLNVYDVLRHEQLLLTRDALARIHERLGAERAEGSA
jgi:large subunit ribosomal protein L4